MVAGTEAVASTHAPDRPSNGEWSELHKEWCNTIFLSESLEFELVFRATIKPAHLRRIRIHLDRSLVFALSFLFANGPSGPRKDLQQPVLFLQSPQAMREVFCR